MPVAYMVCPECYSLIGEVPNKVELNKLRKALRGGLKYKCHICGHIVTPMVLNRKQYEIIQTIKIFHMLRPW